MDSFEENDSTDSEYCSDSDSELQRAFNKGKLKPGLTRLVPSEPKKFTNNVAGMKQKFEAFRRDLPWVERMDITTEPFTRLEGDDVDDDFKKELIFYRQAQAAVLHAIPRLQSMGVVTRRPDDYYAEMAKPDEHMKKIREKLMTKKTNLERSEAAKKLREAKKYGKKVQQEVSQQRQKEKRELAEAVKKYRKGKANNLSEILEGKESKPSQPNKKRQLKNKKFGFGGQKKRGKRNTKESMEAPWKKSKSGQSKGGKGKGKPSRPGKATRPGKARRQQNKQKRK